MKVPRPAGGSKQSDGVGKIYLKYDKPESATTALKALAGRIFSERTVVVSYFAEVGAMGFQTVLPLTYTNRTTLTSTLGDWVKRFFSFLSALESAQKVCL